MPPIDPSDDLTGGLNEAFRRRGDENASPASSVLRILQANNPSVRAVHLDSPSVDDAPVKVTEEAKRLRDPSGRYQLLGEIGRGGVGTVYKGRDQDLGRDVAMKVLRDEYATRPDVLARFVEEAQIGGQLQHPGIVPVYELGLQAGERPYLAMKLVKGETLAVHLARRSEVAEDRRRCLGVFEQVCQTMAYAHARRVVHRDLKPANVMIGAFGEVQVVDWGFAKVLPKGGVADEHGAVQRASERSVIETVRSSAEPGSGTGSVAGSVFGTPAYMPPEQAHGEIDRVDQRSDVFALGAILCEILTGEPPYREADGDVVRQAANAQLDGAHERLVRCGADGALVQLCEECLSPAKRARPESAQEVADRVGAFLTSVEERAQKAELRAAEVRFKHRVTLVAASAALLLVTLGGATWIYLQHDAQQRRAAETQQLSAAMNLTSQAFGEAQAQGGDDITLWDVAEQSAASLALLLETDDIEPGVRGQARMLLGQVKEESRVARERAAQQAYDRDMVERLVNLRMPVGDESARERGWQQKEYRRLDAEYAAAFTAFLGSSPFDLPAESALAALRAGDVELELATSLDHWALARDGLAGADERPDSRGTERLRQLAALLDDDDSVRAELRRLLPDAAERKQELEALAERADLEALTPAGCRVLAEALWRAGSTQQAVEVLTLAREAHPTDFDLCFQLAFAYERLEQPRWRDAEHTYRIANALRPEHNEVLHRQGIALEKGGRLADAERLFATLAERDAGNAHWYSHLGEVRDLMGEIEAAADSYRMAYELAPDDVQQLNNYGMTLLQLRRFVEATELLQRAANLHPKHLESRVNLGNALGAMGKHEDALAAYESALAIDARFRPAWIGKGGSLRTLGRIRKGHEAYEQALALDPGDPMTLASIGASSLQLGRVDESIEYCEQALEQTPNVQAGIFLFNDPRPAAHFTLAQAFDVLAQQSERSDQKERGREHREKALTHYRQVDVRRIPSDLLNNLGGAFLAHRQFDEAIACARLAIARSPRLPNPHVSLGDAYRLQAYEAQDPGRQEELYEQAVSCYGDAIRIIEELDVRPDAMFNPHRQAYNNLGSVLSSLGRSEQSLAAYESALDVDSDYANAHLNLAAEYAKEGDTERAIAKYERAAKLFARDRTPFAVQWGGHARQAANTLRAMVEVLDGDRPAESPAEWQNVISMAYERSAHRAVVELAERTLAEHPELVDSLPRGPYNSACSAVLLAADPATDAAERARLRELARSWLERCARTAEKQLMQWALKDSDFASVRGEALGALPEAEREAWRRLWATITEVAGQDGG